MSVPGVEKARYYSVMLVDSNNLQTTATCGTAERPGKQGGQGYLVGCAGLAGWARRRGIAKVFSDPRRRLFVRGAYRKNAKLFSNGAARTCRKKT